MDRQTKLNTVRWILEKDKSERQADRDKARKVMDRHFNEFADASRELELAGDPEGARRFEELRNPENMENNGGNQTGQENGGDGQSQQEQFNQDLTEPSTKEPKTQGEEEAEKLEQQVLNPNSAPETPIGGPAVTAGEKKPGTTRAEGESDGGETDEDAINRKKEETEKPAEEAAAESDEQNQSLFDRAANWFKGLGKNIDLKSIGKMFSGPYRWGIIIAVIIAAGALGFLIFFSMNWIKGNSRVTGSTYNQPVQAAANKDTVDKVLALANVTGITAQNSTQILKDLNGAIAAIEADPKISAADKASAADISKKIDTYNAAQTTDNGKAIISAVTALLDKYFPSRLVLQAPASGFFNINTSDTNMKNELTGVAVANANNYKTTLQPALGGLLMTLFNQKDAIGITGKLTIGCLITSPNASGGDSLHTSGQAVDIQASAADMKNLQTWLYNNYDKTGTGTLKTNNIYVYEVLGPNTDLWIQKFKKTKGDPTSQLAKENQNIVHIGISLSPDSLSQQKYK